MLIVQSYTVIVHFISILRCVMPKRGLNSCHSQTEPRWKLSGSVKIIDNKYVFIE